MRASTICQFLQQQLPEGRGYPIRSPRQKMREDVILIDNKQQKCVTLIYEYKENKRRNFLYLKT